MRMCNAQIVIRKLANNLKYLYIPRKNSQSRNEARSSIEQFENRRHLSAKQFKLWTPKMEKQHLVF